MKWVPKDRNENLEKRVSFAIDNTSRITNVLKLINTLGSNLSIIPSSSNSLADCSNHLIHYWLWMHKAHDGQSNAAMMGTVCFAWLWHRRISNLNFDYINLLSKKDVVIGLPKWKYVKDQLCSSCEVSKAKRTSFKTKAVPSSNGRLNLLHMDLCGPMRVASINKKKYILASFPNDKRHQIMTTLAPPLTTKCTSSVNKSSSLTDNSKQQDTPPTMNNPSSIEPTTPTINVHAEENNDNQVEYTQVQQAKFINPFYDPLSQVHGNPSKPVQTRRQLTTDPEMYMFALTMSTAEPKTIKDAMDNSAWIEAMQEELHQFDRLQV
ncbi:retrovirus-related pol polyprotein from transposon TNT 1-94 [Tanacetum coccineum]